MTFQLTMESPTSYTIQNKWIYNILVDDNTLWKLNTKTENKKSHA